MAQHGGPASKGIGEPGAAGACFKQVSGIWTNSTDRVAHCRRQARRLRRLAQTEPEDAFRRHIVELAQQYERIAENIEIGMDDPAVATLVAAASREHPE